MTTLSARLGLKKSTTADRFRIAEYAENWGVLDNYPGVFICASTSRPTTWTAAHTGMLIQETDTGLIWRWSGTAFVRSAGSGLLLNVTRTADLATVSTSLVVALTAAVTVPAGNRPMQVMVSGPGVYNTIGLTRLALFRGATPIQSWLSQGRTGATYDLQPRPVALSLIDVPPAGAVSYTLQFSAEVGFGGTSTLQSAVNNPLGLAIVEL